MKRILPHVANALSGDTVKARRVYDDLFALWKNADAGVPLITRSTGGTRPVAMIGA